LAKTREVFAGRPNVRTLQGLEAELSEMRERLRPWDEELDRQLALLRAAFQRLDTIAAVWEATVEVSRREGAAETTMARITTVRGEIDQVRSTVVKLRNQILAVRDRLVDPSARGAGLVPAVIGAAAVLRIGRRFIVPAMAPLAWGILVFFVVDRARDFLDTMPTLKRVVFLVEGIGVLGFLILLLRPSRIADIPAQLRGTSFLRLLGAAMRVAAVVLAISIVADLFGWGDLASMLGNGVVRAGYLGFFVFVLLKVFQSLAIFALVLWPFRLLRAISGHRLLVRRRLERVLSVIAVGL
jgi:hypothetical protein